MPVKFEGESEYDRQYKWIESKKSAAFQPSPDQKAPVAGVKSTCAGLSIEPPIQRRKKPVPLSKTLPSQFPDEAGNAPTEDDFFLLGNTTKFAENVKYRNSRKALKHKLERGKTYQISVDPEPVNERSAAPIQQSKLDYETLKLREAEKALSPERRRSPEKRPVASPNRHVASPERQSPNRHERCFAPPEPRPDRYLPSPERHAITLNAAPAERQKSPEKRSPGKGTKRAHSGRPKKSEESPTRKEAPHVHHREARASFEEKDSVSQAVQTEKPVDRKVDKKEKDLALQHRAGLKPDHPPSIKRVSEYQKQYQWKQGIASSPLLAADEIVYKSSSVLKPQVSLPHHSEYVTQFQSPPRHVYAPVHAKPDGAPRPAPCQHKEGPQRATKPDGGSPSKISKPERTEQNLTDKEKNLLKEASNPQKPYPPHGKHRRSKSEYAANFKAPQTYLYVDGSWKGAKPAHVTQNNEAEAPSSAQSWYQEVLELRQKADEYRKRALGTHFSRMHTAQVLAKNAELWDAASDDSRTLSALSLETGSQASSRRGKPPAVPALSAGAENESSRPVDDSEPLSSASHRSEYGSESDLQEDFKSTPRADTDSDEGRVPTPRLHQYARHHLDVTTPAVGGALLTSPKQAWSEGSEVVEERVVRVQKPRVKQHHRHGYELDVQCTCGADDKPKPKKTKPVQLSVQRTYTPTFGKPTLDQQPLLDEEASEDRILSTRYLPKPEDRAARMERLGLDLPKTIDERFGETYVSPPVKLDLENDDDDDGALSTSVRSIASSCSVASETLERARHRRDEFWGRQDKRVGTN